MSLSLHSDLRYALREIKRHPRAALVPILTLALGIGAATTVFSVVNGVLLRPLPYHEPERLINIWNDIGEGPSMQSLPAVSATDWRFYRQNTKAFIDFAGALGGVELGATGIVGGAGGNARTCDVRRSVRQFPATARRAAVARTGLHSGRG